MMASSPSRTLKLTYLGDSSQLSKSTKTAESDVSSLGKRVGKVGKAIAVGFVAVGAAGIAMGKKLFDAFEEVSTANARIEAVVTSMGNFEGQIAGVTDRLVAQANATARLTGVDRNLIKESQALLLTFDSVNKTAGQVGGVLDRATQAAVDLAAAGFGTVTTNAAQLGKALEDPILGLTALTRSGVTFTDEQKDLIQSLVESNQLLAAQDIVLKAIERQVGGVAEATANGSQKIRQAFGIITEQIATALAPAFERLIEVGLRFVDKVAAWWQDNGPDVIEKFNAFKERVLQAAMALGEFVGRLGEGFRRILVNGSTDIDGLKDAFAELRETINEGFGEGGLTGFALKSFESTLTQTMADGIFVLEGIVRAVNFVLEAFQALPDNLKKVGEDLKPFFDFLVADVNLTIDAVNRFIATLHRLPRVDIPEIPSITPGSASSQGARQNIVVNVSGAMDPEGTARLIQRTLTSSNLRVGNAPTPGLAAVA